jgi:hypothetical protein
LTVGEEKWKVPPGNVEGKEKVEMAKFEFQTLAFPHDPTCPTSSLDRMDYRRSYE